MRLGTPGFGRGGGGGGGGSVAWMTKFTAAIQEPLTLWAKLCGF